MVNKMDSIFATSTLWALLIILAEITYAIDQPTKSSCGLKFGDKCSCGVIQYDYKKQYVVNCTNTAFTNTSVLEYLPSDVEVLIFSGNILTTLPWNIFGKDNEYPKLRIIDLSNNHIREIHGKTFHHVSTVERLILNHNNISISPNDDELNYLHPRIFSNFINIKELHLTNAFADNTSPALSKDLHSIFDKSNLTKLIKLHLEQNEISKFIDRDVFCELPELEDLHLADNHLNEISFNVLCLKKLRFLDFERNRFKFVKQKDLDLLNLIGTAVEHLTIDFSLNPFVCNCSTQPFVNWLHSTHVDVRNKEQLVCHREPGVTASLLDELIPSCKVVSLKQYSGTGHRMALFVFTAIFIMLIVLLVGAIVYLSRERIKHFVSPVISTRKVYYTTIKDDEVHEVIV